MEDRDGTEKNYDQVMEQVAAWRVEMKGVGVKIANAWKTETGFHRYRRVLHHASGYLEETIDQLPKVWFYTWGIKWTFVAYLICPESFHSAFESVKSLF